MCRKMIYLVSFVLVLGLIGGGVLAKGRADDVGELANRISRQLRVDGVAFRSLVVPDNLPEFFTVTVEHEGLPRVLNLQKDSVRGPNFRGLVQQAGGELVEIDPGPVRTYRGYIEGEPDTTVAASLLPSGLRATVYPELEPSWSVQPIQTFYASAARAGHIIYSQEDVERVDLGDDVLLVPEADGERCTDFHADQQLSSSAADTSYAFYGCGVMQAELGFDVDYAYYRYCGYSTNTVTSYLEDLVNCLNVIYVRDCLIEYQMGTVVIRTDLRSCPYYYSDALYNEMRDQWADGQYGTSHDVAQLITGRTDMGYGGTGWVAVVCESYRYSVSGGGWGLDNLKGISRHELGHNWGCLDYHAGCPEGKTIMCGNSIPRFSGEEVKTIIAHRNSRTCLVDIGPYAAPVPPYAALDWVTMNVGDATIPINVLANDHDANCDELVIDYFDTTSQLGGTITRSGARRPGEGNTLIYTCPPGGCGVDRFNYTIRDSTGRQSMGTVVVAASAIPAAGWSNQDIGTTGGSASESGGTWTIRGDGSDIWGTSDGFHYVYQPLSGDGEIIARVVSVENTNPWAKAGVMIREGLGADSKHVHLIIAPGNGCRFQLRRVTSSNSESDTLFTNLSHIRAPHWVRLVRDGDFFRAYHSDDGRTWHELVWSPQIVRMAINVYIGLGVTSHAYGTLCIATFDNVYLGWPNWATAPSPADGAFHGDTWASLGWRPGDTAASHDVYFGDNFDDVNDGTGSTFQGNQTGTVFNVGLPGGPFPDGLVPDTTYYWRIDEVEADGTTTHKGDVWSFTTVVANSLLEALDTTLIFTTGGSADWFSQTTTFYNDGDAAQSGDILGDQESWMQTTVSGKGTVKFYWKVSSEEDFDFLEFYIDGSLKDRISGSVNWQQKIYAISTSGSHTLEWRYMKDGATSMGDDCGWVDKVEWVTTP